SYGDSLQIKCMFSATEKPRQSLENSLGRIVCAKLQKSLRQHRGEVRRRFGLRSLEIPQ
uniref:TLDc domain-containing protein n=1 Tax=Parascaris univalens TaxID=6257 RepID=A0A915C4L1_PARUN